jgi:hypothetical protein
MTTRDLIKKWNDVKASNMESAKALGEAGLFEQAVDCRKDNDMITAFISDLQKLETDHMRNTGPG